MTIYVCPLSQVGALARDHSPSRVLSLLDPGSSFPALQGVASAHHLKVAVHDIEEEMEGLDRPAPDHMRAILDFVQAWDRQDPMLIHCYAGLSRSTATAFIAACAHNPLTDEAAIALALREASPNAAPNRRFVALADAALNRNGRMSAAIEAIGRGANWYEIGENIPFSIPSRYA
jgi:predicted protein tyrosine phosphatase